MFRRRLERETWAYPGRAPAEGSLLVSSTWLAAFREVLNLRLVFAKAQAQISYSLMVGKSSRSLKRRPHCFGSFET